MPHTLRMPSYAELHNGTVREFVTLLFWLYTTARRPTLESVSTHIRNGKYPATASRETIRRMLNGTTVPPRWETTEAVLLALASLANHEPSEYVRMGQWRLPLTQLAELLWNRALDDPSGLPNADPWDESDNPFGEPATPAWAPEGPKATWGGDAHSDRAPR